MYYILPIKEKEILNNKNIVQNEKTVRMNLDKTEFVIKVRKESKPPEALSRYTPLTHKEVLERLTSKEWYNEQNI